MPRLYREAPLNSIWEGSGNVICLDVLRAMAASPRAVEAFFAEVDAGARRPTPRLDAFVDDAARRAGRPRRRSSRGPAAWSSAWRSRCRARCWCATATRRSPTRSAPRASPATAGRAFGTLPPGIDFARDHRARTARSSEPPQPAGLHV